MLKFFTNVGILLAIAMLFIYVALYFFQAKLIFYPEILAANKLLKFGPAQFTENFLKISSGETVHYLVFPQSNPKSIILYFHGNAGSLAGWGEVGAELAERTGAEVWIMDYPGFGKSSGPIPASEKAFLVMGREFIQKIKQQNPEAKLFLFGRSIGSGIAGALAASEQVAGLILETPYTSLKDLAGAMMPWVPTFLVRYDFTNLLIKGSHFKEKILIIHGTHDEVIPVYHGEKLAQELESATFLKIQGGRHNDLADFPEYWPAVEKFIKSPL